MENKLQPAKQSWLNKRIIDSLRYKKVERISGIYNVHTVCHEAACPNRNECFSSGTCTFLILGNICTRGCGFCNVFPGVPEAVAMLNLEHTVVTMVTRDDLPDGGASVCA